MFETIEEEVGSLSEVGKKIGRSKSYVSIMRKIARDASLPLLDAWREGDIPFDLVCLVAAKGKPRQIDILRKYLRTTRGRNKRAKSEGRAALLAALSKP
jgi:hypothetical protein